MERIQYLIKEHIYEIHKQAIDNFGGLRGGYNFTDARIESILSRQYPVFGYDKYPTILHKAAMLLYFFTKGHCFRDGNKRIGMQSAIIFLDINGYDDYLDDDEGYHKTMEISELEVNEIQRDAYIRALSRWISERFIKRKPKKVKLIRKRV